jgi:mannose-1-phosphate guanylyltransferase
MPADHPRAALRRLRHPALAAVAAQLSQAVRAADRRETLFQASAARASGPGFAAPLVLTGADFRFIVTEQLAAAGIDPGAC